MPSSTSSSDIPYRDIPDQHWGAIVIVSLLLVAVAVIGWEALARDMYHTPGTFQSGMVEMWADERRKLDTPEENVRVVLTGSSRMLWDADLDIMESKFGHRPVQLALAGTSPVKIVEDIIENTEFDGVILVGVASFLFSSPFAMGDLESWGYYGTPAKEWYDGVSFSKRSGRVLHDFLSLHFGFLDDSFSMPELLKGYVVLANREGAYDVRLDGWKLGDYYEDRQTDMWPPVEDENSFDNAQVKAFWDLPGREHDPEKTRETATAAIEYYGPLIEKLRARGGDIVFVRMPISGLYLEGDQKNQFVESFWSPMAEGVDALFIDTMAYPDLMDGLRTPEWSHLDRASQDLFSERIVPLIAAEYEALRGHSIDQVINQTGRD